MNLVSSKGGVIRKLLFNILILFFLGSVSASQITATELKKGQSAIQAKSPEKSALSAASQKKLLAGMVWVQGGVFTMGSNDKNALNREKPAHKVTLNGFYIGRTEVTVKLWQEVMGWDYSYFSCDDCPVNNISWKNVQNFIKRLNALTGKTFHLPSEAQWEYAAKGGIKAKGYIYSGSNNITEVAWYAGNAKHKSHQVAQKKPNELGLYDMTGNLWEYCLDDMNRSIYSAAPRTNPLYAPNKDVYVTSMKVIRGSGYDFSAAESVVYKRDGATSNVRMADIGFRLAMERQ